MSPNLTIDESKVFAVLPVKKRGESGLVAWQVLKRTHDLTQDHIKLLLIELKRKGLVDAVSNGGETYYTRLSDEELAVTDREQIMDYAEGDEDMDDIDDMVKCDACGQMFKRNTIRKHAWRCKGKKEEEGCTDQCEVKRDEPTMFTHQDGIRRRFADLDDWAKRVREVDHRRPDDKFTVIGPMGSPYCRYCGGPTEHSWDTDTSASDHCDHCEKLFSEFVKRSWPNEGDDITVPDEEAKKEVAEECDIGVEDTCIAHPSEAQKEKIDEECQRLRDDPVGEGYYSPPPTAQSSFFCQRLERLKEMLIKVRIRPNIADLIVDRFGWYREDDIPVLKTILKDAGVPVPTMRCIVEQWEHIIGIAATGPFPATVLYEKDENDNPGLYLNDLLKMIGVRESIIYSITMQFYALGTQSTRVLEGILRDAGINTSDRNAVLGMYDAILEHILDPDPLTADEEEDIAESEREIEEGKAIRVPREMIPYFGRMLGDAIFGSTGAEDEAEMVEDPTDEIFLGLREVERAAIDVDFKTDLRFVDSADATTIWLSFVRKKGTDR